MNYKIGIIGMGIVGTAHATHFTNLGHTVLTYDIKDGAYDGQLDSCSHVFICVNTPSNDIIGADTSNITKALEPLPPHMVVIIKSTIPPGTTRRLQHQFPHLKLFHSPEFLTANNALHDLQHPDRIVVGIPTDKNCFKDMQMLRDIYKPNCPFAVVTSEESELIKYASNIFLIMKIVYSNIISDLCKAYGAYDTIVLSVMAADGRIGPSCTKVEHENGRGAGGHCFPKDLLAMKHVAKDLGLKNVEFFFRALELTNLEYLIGSKKDLEILKGLYAYHLPVQSQG